MGKSIIFLQPETYWSQLKPTGLILQGALEAHKNNFDYYTWTS